MTGLQTLTSSPDAIHQYIQSRIPLENFLAVERVVKRGRIVKVYITGTESTSWFCSTVADIFNELPNLSYAVSTSTTTHKLQITVVWHTEESI